MNKFIFFFYFYKYYFVDFSKMVTDTKLEFSGFTKLLTSFARDVNIDWGYV